MVRLLCINSEKLISRDGSVAHGTDLVKGKIYTARFKTISSFGDECYEVVETGYLHQCVRFKVLTKKDEKKIQKAIDEVVSTFY